jgi:hypothetical protein
MAALGQLYRELESKVDLVLCGKDERKLSVI